MFGLGVTEIILILVVALVIVGPDKLPELARTIAKGFNEFKRTTNDIKRTIDFTSEPEERKRREPGEDEVLEEEPKDEVEEESKEPKKAAPKKATTKKATAKKPTAKKAAPKKRVVNKKEEGAP
jgi:sec-independent protein translocase protein TatB